MFTELVSGSAHYYCYYYFYYYVVIIIIIISMFQFVHLLVTQSTRLITSPSRLYNTLFFLQVYYLTMPSVVKIL